jgi:ribosomal protein L29|tara:strand:- start:458 stop:670 length:213 start_codon:yes stop_codon:yes gene_type:complete
MSKKLVEEMRKLKNDKLVEELDSTIEELFSLRTQASTGQLADVSQLSKTRRKVALLRTLMKQTNNNEANK